MYAEWKAPVPPGPHLTWWNSIDDGRVYEGWEHTRDELALLAAGRDRLVLLGFSQGAMVATALASLVGFGEFPPLASVVLIAGRIPRAEALAHYFERPIRVPSLHVWGLADKVSGTHAPRVFERFDVRTRECAIWTGPHVVPSHGPAKDAIVEFLRAAAEQRR
jgi:pimeloyl-ACP methyl ester carboxylesterase